MPEYELSYWITSGSYISGVSHIPISGAALHSGTQYFIGSAVIPPKENAHGTVLLLRVDADDNYQTDVQVLSIISYGDGEWRENKPLPKEVHHPKVKFSKGIYSARIDAEGIFSGQFYYTLEEIKKKKK